MVDEALSGGRRKSGKNNDSKKGNNKGNNKKNNTKGDGKRWECAVLVPTMESQTTSDEARRKRLERAQRWFDEFLLAFRDIHRIARLAQDGKDANIHTAITDAMRNIKSAYDMVVKARTATQHIINLLPRPGTTGLYRKTSEDGSTEPMALTAGNYENNDLPALFQADQLLVNKGTSLVSFMRSYNPMFAEGAKHTLHMAVAPVFSTLEYVVPQEAASYFAATYPVEDGTTVAAVATFALDNSGQSTNVKYVTSTDYEQRVSSSRRYMIVSESNRDVMYNLLGMSPQSQRATVPSVPSVRRLSTRRTTSRLASLGAPPADVTV